MSGAKNTVEYKDRVVSLTQLAELMGVSRNTIFARYKEGYRDEKLIRRIMQEICTKEVNAKKRRELEGIWHGTWYFKGEPVKIRRKNDKRRNY